MNRNEILDDLPNDNDELSNELIETVVDSAKYAKILVVVSIIQEIWQLIMNFRIMMQYGDGLSGAFGFYNIRSMIGFVLSLVAIYFLWVFSEKGKAMELSGQHEFMEALKSLRAYFLCLLIISLFFRVLQFLGPLLAF